MPVNARSINDLIPLAGDQGIGFSGAKLRGQQMRLNEQAMQQNQRTQEEFDRAVKEAREQAMKQAQQLAEFESIARGVHKLAPLVPKGVEDYPRFIAALDERIGEIESTGGNASDTKQIREMAMAGDIAGINRMFSDVQNIERQLRAKRLGVETPPDTARPQFETIEGDAGSILQRNLSTGELKQVQGRDQSIDRLLAADELARRRDAENRKFQRSQTADEREFEEQKAAEKAAAAEQKKQQELDQTYQTYQTARDGLISGLAQTNTGPIAGRVPAITTEQQVAQGAVSAMAPVLKQLFRVSGEGVFTDRDQTLLLDMVPKRTDSPEAIALKMANIDAIVNAKLGQQQPSAAQSAQPTGRTATNPQTGQRVMELSDGSWVPMNAQ